MRRNRSSSIRQKHGKRFATRWFCLKSMQMQVLFPDRRGKHVVVQWPLQHDRLIPSLQPGRDKSVAWDDETYSQLSAVAPAPAFREQQKPTKPEKTRVAYDTLRKSIVRILWTDDFKTAQDTYMAWCAADGAPVQPMMVGRDWGDDT